MATTRLLNKIDEYVKELTVDDRERLWTAATHIANKFKLKLVDTVGTTRIILKEKGSRTVIKVGYPCHNRAEYAAYKALEHSTVGDLLAPCLNISEEGRALEMAYIPQAIPQAKGEYYWFNEEFVKLRDRLESHFAFFKQYNTYSWGADFHEENMRAMRNGKIKIIDYSNLLADVFSRRPSTTVKGAIKKVLKLKYPNVKVKLTLKNRIISYRDNDRYSYDVAIDPQREDAII